MEEALLTFKGTLLFISHDRYFLNVLADRILEMDQQKLTSYFGGYDAYKYDKGKKKLYLLRKKKSLLHLKVDQAKKAKRKANPNQG